jgi:seryl-tRNA synthetase
VLDIKLIREKSDFVRERLAARGAGDEKLIDGILLADEQRRKSLVELEALKSQRNRVSKEIGALMGQKKIAEAETKKSETRDLGDKIVELEEQVAQADADRDQLMLRVPNLPHATVPQGKSAEDNPEIRVHGLKAAFSFTPKSHIDLCESLKLVDFARGAKLSGSGFLLYTNWGARLERALIQFLLDLHITRHEYTEVSPPFMVGEQCLLGVGQFPKFKDQYYGVAEGDAAENLGNCTSFPPPKRPWPIFIARKSCPKNNCPSVTAPTPRVFGAKPAPPASALAA